MKVVKIVSDTHFYHNKLIELGVRNYANVDEMNLAIMQKWNQEISPNDRVIHLGDFAFGDDLSAIEKIIKQLNGNITLILGNHDTAFKVGNLYTKYFKCLGGMSWNDYYFSHEPVHATVINPKQLRTTGRRATINVHGHLHNGEFCSDKHVNCCFDVVGLDNMVKTLEIE